MDEKKMKQTVLIGLGGTGGRVVNNVAKMLRKNNITINNGIVTCAILDTNQSDNKKISGSGTEIPIIPTCDERTIERYLQDHATKNPLTWCPFSRRFGSETMIDGASEIRVKSRLAFMDTMESSRIYDLERAMEKVFHNRPNTPEKVRVMLVSSLAGGTGSGMFMQVALWLRQFFERRKCMVSIRGIFLLPDIFVRTLKNAQENERKKLYYYANAYASIRELNTLNKICKGNYVPERPIIIPGLFDSRKPPKRPIFDFAFFVDDMDERGAAFEGVADYEELVAQTVYMQLYAPMIDEMVSVEDNLYRSFEKSTEPVFGSCGTAKAVYPIDDMLEYCALRATSDSIANGWGRLDDEINAMIEDQKRAEKDGEFIPNPVCVADTYIKLFDEKSRKTGKEVGLADRLFVRIKNDIFNEKHSVSLDEGENEPITKCKVQAFLNAVSDLIEKSVTQNGGCERVLEIGEDLPDPDQPNSFASDLKNTLENVREDELETIESVLRTFDENKQSYADAIVRSIVPLDMGAINKNDEKSLFGLFQKLDVNNQLHYVHPVAARYLLYKLAKEIEAERSRIDPDTRRNAAIEGDQSVSFDNEATFKKETMEGYWKQIGLITSKKELQFFLRRYKEYNVGNRLLCFQYETEALKQLVLNALMGYVNELIKQMELLFKAFNPLRELIEKDTAANVDRNTNGQKKVLYVYAKEEHKEEMYRSLGIDIADRNEKLFKDIIESVYGKFCVEYRPHAEANHPYIEKSAAIAFYDASLENYKNWLKKENRLNLDIISAIEKESDFDFDREQKERMKDQNEADAVKALLSRESKAGKTKERYAKAIFDYRDTLLNKAVPYLQAEPEAAEIDISQIDNMLKDENNKFWMTTASGRKLQISLQTELTFWGFNPKLEEIFPEIGTKLGANKDTSADEGYPINELYCYSSIYGVKASSIPKFNETAGGEYYENYSAVINTMLRDNSEVDTPHIDKTWHEFLPYVSEDRQQNYNQTLYKTLWLALGYGRIELDESGVYQISEKTSDSFGNETYTFKPLLESGRMIRAAEVQRLITSLRGYPDFEASIARSVQEKFDKELECLVKYVDTEIFQGLWISGDLNPISLIVKYITSKDASAKVKDDMLGGLRHIMLELAYHYDLNRDDDAVRAASVRLLHRLYEKSNMKTKKQNLKELVKEFKSLNLPVGDADDGEKKQEDEDVI